MRMAATSASRARASDSPSRWLQAIGTFGAVLALVILGASMLLRLTTIFGVDGHTISTLPASVENAIRLAHRLAAAAVGLLALCVAIISWTRRPLPSSFIAPIAWIVVSTVMLAIIGPLTPGYRMTTVTVGNVVGGMVLLMAFWWLRESAIHTPLTRTPAEPLLLITILAFLVLIGTLVVVHELGHYLVASWFGVKADKFSVGFGPQLYGRVDKRGTLWRIGALPLGG